MNKQFTASKVHRLSNRIPRSNDEIADAQEALRAFAYMLEAREMAMPVAWLRDSGTAIESEAACVTNTVRNLWLASNPKRIERYTIPLYTHPSSPGAERLAEALRKIVEWQPPYVISSNGGRSSMQAEFGSNGVRDYFRRIAEEALDAHSAQAQPPAARLKSYLETLSTSERGVAEMALSFATPAANVTDAMDAARYRWLLKTQNTDCEYHSLEDLAWYALHNLSSEETSNAIDAAMAQENPNG